MPNNLCGIINLKNQFIVLPIYNYLSISKTNKGKGYYKAELNGKKTALRIDYHDEKTISQND
jgi:hypothetical protein